MPHNKEARNSGDRMNPVTPPEGWGFSQGNNLNLPFLPGLKAGASWSNGVKSPIQPIIVIPVKTGIQ